MRAKTVIQEIAGTVGAWKRCKAQGNSFADKHDDRLDTLEREFLPHGSGIDRGVQIDREKSTEARVLLRLGFNHMDEHGFYDGWTEHIVAVVPTFDGYRLSIGGRNRNDIKDYLHQTLDYALSRTSQVYCESCRFYHRVERPANHGAELKVEACAQNRVFIEERY